MQRPSPRPRSAGRNTLGMDLRELSAILDSYDTTEARAGQSNRDFVRWPFRHDSVRVMIVQGGKVVPIVMACRNISRGGISLLHSAYMHPGTKCVVMLPFPEHGETPTKAWVARCTHRSGVIHEIGA